MSCKGVEVTNMYTLIVILMLPLVNVGDTVLTLNNANVIGKKQSCVSRFNPGRFTSFSLTHKFRSWSVFYRTKQ